MKVNNEEEVLELEENEVQVDEGVKVQLIVFQLGEEEYALPIDQIKEIVVTPRISSVPQTPDYVRGIANIRGHVISIMDFETKFGLKKKGAKSESSHNFTLVIESDEFNIGVLVNQVPNTLSVMSSKIDKSSSIMQYSTMDETVIKGVVNLKDRMIILIDVLRMMEIGELKTKL
ncbi:chemotaxis protein CheW [Reichenbachiella ulvae]|uniref:Chemotaxis protein CheW n=1 Tax=Reichenbachiella ulvae TaxID=2980104 RepID=A0ABT3CNA1_9BACT|nr:chemotaxis protein CheW [Reichenbachiella ulvae]MCV9385203.1 chemotaxis protein CheW [Reichenbachiella ulvae]